jgi:hypothetical protein
MTDCFAHHKRGMTLALHCKTHFTSLPLLQALAYGGPGALLGRTQVVAGPQDLVQPIANPAVLGELPEHSTAECHT